MKARVHNGLSVLVLPAFLFFAFRAAAAFWYGGDLDGVPDEGAVPTGLLPWFMYTYRIGGTVWNDAVRLRVWTAACAGYLVPAAVAVALPHSKRAVICAIAVVGGLVAFAILSIPKAPPQSEYIAYFTTDTIAASRQWIAVLALAGVAAGGVVRWALRLLPNTGRNGSNPDDNGQMGVSPRP